MNVRFLPREWRATALVAVVWVGGCSNAAPTPERTRATAHAIQGGSDDTTHNYAVGVCVGQQGYCEALCSGALIAPNLVVTARHCVDQSPQQIDCASATFGPQMAATNNFHVTTDPDMMQATQGWHSVKKIITPTPTPVCGNDIALLILNNQVGPAEATPMVVPVVQYPMSDATRYDTVFTAIGYGSTSPANAGAGTRRIRQNIALVCVPGRKGFDCGTLTGTNLTPSEFVAQDGTCEGDSGSSAYDQTLFDQGIPTSFGVLSRGGQSADGTTCEGSIYTRLDAWRDLIVSAVTEASQNWSLYPKPVPDWTIYVPPPPVVDSGTPAKDAGEAGAPSAELGATCTADKDCKSSNCAAATGDNFVCTQACDASTPCPDGLTCSSGLCFAGVEPAHPTTTTTSSGCSIAFDPTKPIPWRSLAAAAALALVAVRRRRR